jgi:hypothetical protein
MSQPTIARQTNDNTLVLQRRGIGIKRMKYFNGLDATSEFTPHLFHHALLIQV